MNRPDTPLQPEPPKNACVVNATTPTIGAEQLRLWLGDRRNRLRAERGELLKAAERLKIEIAAYDQLLAELTIG